MYPFYEAKKSGEPNFFNAWIANNMRFPPHLHSYVEVLYVIEGSLTMTINDNTKELHHGDVAVSFPNDIHSYDTHTNSKIILVIFSPELIGSYFSRRMDKTLENPFICSTSVVKEIPQLFYMLQEEFSTSNNKYVIKGLLYTIFGKLDSVFKLISSSHTYNNTTQTLLKYIESHYNENLSLQSIAKELGFSKFHLSRIFTQKIGYQFNDYINRLRINMAQKLLSETDEPVLNIAMECGFESQRNFNRIFKEYTSFTPTEFRSSLRNLEQV